MESGPIGSTARETAVNSTVVWRDWPAASMGMENRSWLSPIGRSPRADVVGVRPGLSMRMSTFTVSDTVTRLLDTSMVAVNDVLPSDHHAGEHDRHGQQFMPSENRERYEWGDGESGHGPSER